MRLRDFCAGPARTTRHFFPSSEFIEGDVVTEFEGGLAPADGTPLSRCRYFFGDSAQIEILLNRFDGEIGGLAPLLSGSSIHAPSYSGRKLNCVLSLAHSMSRPHLRHRYFKSFR